MERRVLVAIILSFVVLYAYQLLVVKPKPGGATPPPTAERRDVVPPARPSGEPAAAPNPRAVPLAAAALIGDRADRDIRVETRDVLAVFTNRGARLKSWRLKRYLDASREPLELIATELTATEPLPFSLRLSDDSLSATANDAVYSVGTAVPSGEIAAPVDVRFEYRDVAGLHVVKQFHFEPTSYIVTVRIDVAQGDRQLSPVIQWGPAVGDAVSEVSRFTKRAEALLAADGKVQRLTPKDLAKQSTFDG